MSNGCKVILLPEAWVKRVSDFVVSGRMAEEGEPAGDRPEVLFSRSDPIVVQGNYSDYNIRSRHFRCLETFFIEVDEAGEIQSVVGLEGLLPGKRTVMVNLVIARPREGVDKATRMRELLEEVLRRAGEFVEISKLRITYLYDHNFSAPIQAQVWSTIIEAPERLGFIEEARIPNETGPGRDAVLLTMRAAEPPAESPVTA